MEISKIVEKQKSYLESKETLDVNFRIDKLKELKSVIKDNEKLIVDALYKDLGKSSTESYMAEIGMVLEDLSYIIRHTNKWSKDKIVSTPLAQFPSISFMKPSPYGIVSIISPWNYPFLLTMGPLVGAIAAGNTCIVKPSEYSVETSKVMKKLVEEVFDKEYVAFILGGKETSEELLDQDVDYIFYTGSPRVGKIVMNKASQKLIPVTLELGGKSPVIVDKKSNISLAAKRICFGKILNAGQTCVAPDYIFVHEDVKEKLVKELKKWIEKFLGTSSTKNNDYSKIINERQFNRLVSILDEEKDNIIYGGKYDKKSYKIEPTLIDADFDSKSMEEELFGPILPIISYSDLEEVIKYINKNPKPLALYIFSNSEKVQEELLESCSFGGGCINDTIIHLATSKMGFGGVGSSGMGSYHGKFSFDTFTHYKSIVKKSTLIDLPMRYMPYKKIYDKIIRIFMR